MYAVIRSGGKQYKVSKDDIISVEKLTAEAGDKISLDEVLMISEKDELIIGDPIIKGATVNAEVIEQKRAKKIIVFKKKRRQNYRRKNGHQQNLTTLKIVDIKAIATKKVAVINIMTPTIKVLDAPDPTKARIISNVEIGAANIS